MRNVGRLFGRLGDDVAGALKRWWRGGPDLSKALKHEAIEDIPDAVHKAKLFRGKMADDISRRVRAGREGVFKELNTRSAELKRLREEYGRANRALRKTQKDLEIAKSRRDYSRMRGNEERFYEQERVVDALEQDLARQSEDVMGLKGTYDNALMDKKVLENYYSALKDSPQSAITNIKANPRIQGEFPSLGNYVDEVEDALVTKNQILNSTSRNIANDSRFAKEYLREIHPNLGKDVGAGVYARNWMANPKNMEKLEQLRLSRKFRKFLDVEEGGKAAREALRGLSRKEIISKLGLPAASIALTAGPLAVMSWFDEEQDEMVAESGSASSTLKSFKANDLGAVIQRQTLQAVNTIQDALHDAETEFGENPSKAAETLTTVLVENKAVIDNNLARWELVIRSSDDPRAAQLAGQRLSEYSREIGKQLVSVEQLTAAHLQKSKTPDVPQGGGIAGNRPTQLDPEHIKSVQSYLSGRFPNVAPTGQLDRPTVQALRALEQQFDRMGNTGRFTSTRLLVRPKEGHLIELQDLKNLEKMLQRGR